MRRAWVVALALAAPGTAQAYVRSQVDPGNADSPCLYWDTRTVPYVLARKVPAALSPDAAYEALRRSFQAWTDAACSDFTFQDSGLTDSQAIGFNKALLDQPQLSVDVASQNTVVFRQQDCDGVVPVNDDCRDPANDDCSSRYDCWPYASGVIALTTTSYSSHTGQILDADIELDAASFGFTTTDPPAPVCRGSSDGGCIGFDLENAITHEAGHVLGLAHSGDPSSTMAASATAGDTNKRTLHADDLAGLCAIYPAGAPPVTCNEPPASSSQTQKPRGGCGAAPPGGLLGLLGLLGLRGLRGRRGR